MLKISVIFLPVIWEVNYANRRLNNKKEVLFEEHSKDYVIAKQKIINKFR